MEDLIRKLAAIEVLAKKKKLTIQKLCILADVNNSTWTRWKQLKTEPQWRSLRKLELTLEKYAPKK